MSMKKNFLKFLLLGVFTLSLGAGFVGCKDYDDDIDDIWNKLNELEAKITGNGTKTVADIAPAAAGKITVTYTDGTSKEITISDSGTGTGNMTIGTDGYWYNNGVKTDFLVVAGNPRIASDGYWEFATVKDGAVVWTKSAIYAGGAYIVDAGDSYELWVAEKGSTTLKKIVISKGSAGLGKIDILGWITDKGDVNENISISTDVKNGTNDTYVVNYAWIEVFQQENNYTSTTGAWSNKASSYSWKGMTEVAVKNVLNTLGAERKGILVQVSPANADLASMTFTLENSKNEVLPVVLEEAEKLTGLLTRAATSSALYFIPMTYQDKSVTYEKNGSTAPANVNYAALFRTDALYTLVEESTGFRSEYTPWTATATPTASAEAAVQYVTSGSTQISGAINPPVTVTSYKIQPNVAYEIEFNQATLAQHVVDYYVEVKDNNAYVQAQFGVVIDLAAGTFSVTRQPDNLTLATFTLTVYKLGVDGKIYVEDIVIYPVRQNLSEVIFDANYTITDENGHGTPFTGGSPASGQLSATATADMANMFTKLAGEASGLPAAGTTMKDRWQNSTYGAKFWTLASVTIDGKSVDGATYEDSQSAGTFPTLAAWQTMFFDAGSQIVFSKNATGTPAANDVTGNLTTGYSANLYDARYVILKPAYARADGATPMFDIGKEYVLTFDFYDEDTNGAPGTKQNYLSSAVIKFTPVLPALDGMFVKEPEYWNGNVLNGYYRTPGTWAPAWFYDAANTGNGVDIPWVNAPATPGSTFYNVYSNTALAPLHAPANPYDGGFLRFGQPTAATDKQWLGTQTTLAFKDRYFSTGPNVNWSSVATIGTQQASGFTGNPYLPTTQGQTTIVELLNQTPTPATTNNAYDKELNMSIIPGLYLNVYDYTDYDMYDSAIEALEFKLKIMSALDKGEIKGTNASGSFSVVLGSTGSNILKIDDTHLIGYNYNNVSYSLFQTIKTAGGAVVYDYRYINEVEFYIPASEGSKYTFVNAAGTPTPSPTTAIAPTWPSGTGTTLTKAYVAIEPSNTTTGATTKLGVRVTDRFGRVKEVEVPFTITVQ